MSKFCDRFFLIITKFHCFIILNMKCKVEKVKGKEGTKGCQVQARHRLDHSRMTTLNSIGTSLLYTDTFILFSNKYFLVNYMTIAYATKKTTLDEMEGMSWLSRSLL